MLVAKPLITPAGQGKPMPDQARRAVRRVIERLQAGVDGDVLVLVVADHCAGQGQSRAKLLELQKFRVFDGGILGVHNAIGADLDIGQLRDFEIAGRGASAGASWKPKPQRARKISAALRIRRPLSLLRCAASGICCKCPA